MLRYHPFFVRFFILVIFTTTINVKTIKAMKKGLFLLLFILIITAVKAGNKGKKLFNGRNLDGWSIVVSKADLDPDSVFMVKDKVIYSSGKPNAYLRTNDVYNNYQLHLEWRWVEKPSNSGVLLHANGYEFWPNAIEAQLKAENAGDIVFIGYGVSGKIKGEAHINTENRFKIVPKFEKHSEKTAGEWNSYDIKCEEDNITVRVNGILQNKASNLSLTGGAILLQSEGGPIEFRNIYLKRLKK